MTETAGRVLQAYAIEGNLVPLGSGHIHDTYAVQTNSGATGVLQRVNEFVFKDGDLVMRQTRQVLAHWKKQKNYVVPGLIHDAAGRDWVRVDGELWRMWEYLADTQVLDPLTDPAQVYLVACAFADFQVCMRTLPGPPLTQTIDGFLDYHRYLDDYVGVRRHAPEKLDRLIQAGAQMSLSRLSALKKDLMGPLILFFLLFFFIGIQFGIVRGEASERGRSFGWRLGGSSKPKPLKVKKIRDEYKNKSIENLQKANKICI